MRYRGSDSLESHKVYKVYILENEPYFCTDSYHFQRKRDFELYKYLA
jgi:hypothetical protein